MRPRFPPKHRSLPLSGARTPIPFPPDLPSKPNPEPSGLPRTLRGAFGCCHWTASKPLSWPVPHHPVVGLILFGGHSFSEMSHLRLGVQKVCQLLCPLGLWGSHSSWNCLARWGRRRASVSVPSPQTPDCFLCLLCCPVPVALLTGVGSLWPNPTFSFGCLASCCHRSLQGREGLTRGLGTEFVLCVRMCVLSCSRFDFEGLESGDDGAFDKLRSWSRSIEDLQPPSALSAPFTNSLARSARQSVLRYVCSRSARLPPPAPVQVPGNSGECSCSTLASRLSSLALCLPVCLWSVLSVSLTLPSDLSWVSTSPSAVPTPSGVPALPFSPPLWGPLHSSFSLCHSSRPLRQGLSSPGSLTFTGGSSSSPLSVSLWLRTLSHQLLGDQLPPILPAAHLPFTSSCRPFLAKAARCSFVCSILRAVLPGGRWMDLMTEPLLFRKAFLWVLWPFLWSLSHGCAFFLLSFGFCPLTLLIILVMHKQIPFVLPLFSRNITVGGAKSDVAPHAPKAFGVRAAFSGILPQGMCGRFSNWKEEEGRSK